MSAETFTKNIRLPFFLILLFVVSCSSSSPVQEEVISDGEPKAQQQESKDKWGWDYDGDRGPENWAKLNPQYDMCSQGQKQSPINLVWQKPSSPNPLKISYQDSSAVITNTGYTYRIELTPESTISYGGVDYILEKIELRTPSEHKLSDNQLPMELQFYHRTSNGLKQALISLFVISGKPSPWFDEFWSKASAIEKFSSSPGYRLNPSQFIPPRQTFYQYEGSLTHPPCLEGVQWFVFNTPLQLSQEQVMMLRAKYNSNIRPVQPLNNRKILNF